MESERKSPRFVGNSVVFYTSESQPQFETNIKNTFNRFFLLGCRCQIIALQGHDATNRTRLIAPIGSQITGLQFEGSHLTGVYLERVPFDGSHLVTTSIWPMINLMSSLQKRFDMCYVCYVSYVIFPVNISDGFATHSGPMAVSSVLGHVGSAVDKLVLRLRDGSTRRYGFDGGYQAGPYDLDDDELKPQLCVQFIPIVSIYRAKRRKFPR